MSVLEQAVHDTISTTYEIGWVSGQFQELPHRAYRFVTCPWEFGVRGKKVKSAGYGDRNQLTSFSKLVMARDFW